ncbi:AI-2E family transporter [Candidatus Saccharibacteria bacterium]|nr:AI-2E family transporter [Candidatus Saccharibacteria bacterium]
MQETVARKEFRALTIAVILAVLLGAYFVRHFFTPLVLAAIAAYLFGPVYNWLHRKLKSKSKAAGLTLLVSFLVLLVPVVIILFLTVLQISHLTDVFKGASNTVDLGRLGQQVVSSVNDLLSHFPGAPTLSVAEISDKLNSIMVNLANGLFNLIVASVGSISSFITSLFIYIYAFISLLTHKQYLVNTIKRLNPLGPKLTETYLEKMGLMTGAMVRGQFVIALCQGLAEALFFYAVGIHGFFFFLFILFSLMSVIPLGAGILTIPWGIGMILVGNIWQGITVLLGHFLVVTNIDNVLRPKLVPKNVRLDPALTLVAVFSGLAAFGFLGIVIGPVIMIVIKLTIEAYLEATKKGPAKAKPQVG